MLDDYDRRKKKTSSLRNVLVQKNYENKISNEEVLKRINVKVEL